MAKGSIRWPIACDAGQGIETLYVGSKKSPIAASSNVRDSEPSAPFERVRTLVGVGAALRGRSRSVRSRVDRIILNDPTVVPFLATRVTPESLRDDSARAILRACYDSLGEGKPATFESIALSFRRIDADLWPPNCCYRWITCPCPNGRNSTASYRDQLAGTLDALAFRDWHDRLRELKEALEDTDATTQPDEYQALRSEYLKTLNQRPNTRRTTAS